MIRRYAVFILPTVVALMVLTFLLTDPIRAAGGSMKASYYGEELRNSPTASGEPFNPDIFTAAHKTLPLQSRLTVCRDSCIQVRVNDRGPYSGDRELDLSKSAADEIGLTEEGVGEVTVSEPVKQLPFTGGG